MQSESLTRYKISIIGVGHVGSTVGFVLAMRGLATEIVLCSRDGDDDASKASHRRAAMNALDIKHAIAFTSHRIEVRAGTSADTKDSDIIVMTASEPVNSVNSRMDWLTDNSLLMRRLIPRLADLSPRAIFINVTNPVDVISHHIYTISGFDWRKVVGTGTLIDTLRLRRRLADELNVNALDVRAYIIGEHGDTSLATLSGATVGGMSLSKITSRLGAHHAMLADAEDEAKNIGYEIFQVRGYTNYAVAMAVELIVDAIVNDLSVVLPVSVLLDGLDNIPDGVFLSIPCTVGRNGVQHRLMPDLNAEETALFSKSADTIREAIRRTK